MKNSLLNQKRRLEGVFKILGEWSFFALSSTSRNSADSVALAV